jgi:hypothetical protein
LREPRAGPRREFVLQQQPQALIKAQALGVGCGELLFETGREAVQLQVVQLLEQGFGQHDVSLSIDEWAGYWK